MELQGDLGLYLSGEPVKIESCGIYITQPKIKDIVKFGENEFMTIVKLFSDIKQTVDSIKEGKTELDNVPDFQIIIELLRDERGQIRRYGDLLFQLCCPDFIVEYSAHSIDFKVEENGVNVGMLNAFNYDDFAITIKELFLPQSASEKEPEYNYDKNNVQARRLAEKIKKNREKLARAMSKKQGSDTSLFGLYISILSIGLNIDVNTLYDYTPFQIYDSFKRYLAKYQRDRYDSMLMIPFADTSKLQENPVDSWFESIYKPQEEQYNSLEKLNQISNTA